MLIAYANGQSLTVPLDYQAWYEVPTKTGTDTVMVRVDKQGRVLYTDSDLFNTRLGDVFRNKPAATTVADNYHLVLDATTMEVHLQFGIGSNTMYMSMSLEDFLPSGNIDSIEQDINIVSELSENTLDVNGRTSLVYSMYPENDPFQAIQIAMDPKLPVDNNTLIGKFFDIMLRASKSEGEIKWDMPQGLITQVKIEGLSILKAIDIKEKASEITIEHQFTIKE